MKKIIKRAAVFAAYSPDGNIYEDVFSYLIELKKYVNYIIYITDNTSINEDSLIRVNNLVDEVIIERHEEYDFGSYKRGFKRLKNNIIFKSIDKLLFLNDSVIFQGNSLKKVFLKETNTKFYGLTWHAHGFYPDTLNWDYLPHNQSYFLSIDKEIANTDWFSNFIDNIKKEDIKDNVIAKYEIGLSRLIEEHEYNLDCFYPKVNEWFEPCGYYLSQFSNYNQQRLFLKRKPFMINNL